MKTKLTEVAPLRAASRGVVRELGILDNRCSAGASLAQCHALLELEKRGVLTSSALADTLRIDRSTASRTAAQLVRRGLAKRSGDTNDRRRRPLVLNARGRRELERIHARADAHVHDALALLTPEERATVVAGMQLYEKALARARAQAGCRIRRVERGDDPLLAGIIRSVMTEHGVCGPGTSIHDPEVDKMWKTYQGPRARYFVVERDGRVIGGAGFAPLAGADARICELQKMYLVPEARGLGVGARLLATCLDEARAAGYQTCYLETSTLMARARRLYESFGFTARASACGATGHFGCDAWYERRLDEE